MMIRRLVHKRIKAINARHFLLELRLRREEVASFDQYPFVLPAVRALDTFIPHPKVTFLVGENGTGKSTLLEAIAVALGLNAEGGSRNFRFENRASHSDLHRYLEIRRGLQRPRSSFFLRAESYFNLATEIEALDAEPGGGPFVIEAYGRQSLHEQSHGESFFALFQHRFVSPGLYLLDEPEAALSPQRQMSFLTRLHDLVATGSQFLIATHSPIIMAYPDAQIYRLGEGAPQPISYKDTDHYKVTRDFLMRPEQMLAILMRKS
jgi:predicted ATPase